MIYVRIASVKVLELNNLRDISGAYASFQFENSGVYRKILLNEKLCSFYLHSFI